MKLEFFAAIALSFSLTPAFGYDFTEADALFARRGEGPAQISAAVNAYEATIGKELADDEMIYASEQLARLHAYRAQLEPRTRMSARVPHYQACFQATERIAQLGKNLAAPQYYFWAGTCKLLWAEASGVETVLKNSKAVIDLLNAGHAIDPTYEGGGFDRVLGGLYTKLPIFNPWGPAGDVRKGIRHLEASIGSPAYGGAQNPETAGGEYYYESYWYYAQALESAGRRDEAISQLEGALDRIGEGEVSEMRVPETKIAEGLMRDLLAELKQPL
jgi:hypothetical protein